MELNVSQFALIRIQRVCASVVIPAEWDGWIPEVVLLMLSGVRNACFYSVCQKSEVFLVRFSWFNSSMLGFCTRASWLQSSCRKTSLLISSSAFSFYLHRFWRTGVRLVFVLPLCVTHIPGSENVEKGLSKVWMAEFSLGSLALFFLLLYCRTVLELLYFFFLWGKVRVTFTAILWFYENCKLYRVHV